MSSGTAPLFTRRFLTMCAFSFTVFLSAFQLLPVAPFRMIALGGSTFTAGLFLGVLTYASALSAPLTGALADRWGRRRQLLVCSLAIAVLAGAYAVATRPGVVLLLALIHGVFWSGLISATAAYTTELIPATRRAEGIGYHGLFSVLAIAIAPSVGLWVYQGGWIALCASIGALDLLMAAIAWRIRDDRVARPGPGARRPAPKLEWRVTVAAFTVFLGAFGYGGVTSFVALIADNAGLRPRALYFSVLGLAIVCSRGLVGRLADRLGTTRVLVPSLVLASLGYALLALPPSLLTFTASAMLVGLGFGSVYPVFAAGVMRHVDRTSRGAAFGGILAAMDTGVGTGSIAVGLIATTFGFSTAFGLAAVLALAGIPYFRWIGARVLAQRIDDRTCKTP
jgi:MFS family permease